ncbi:MAG: hypothetical protein ACU0GE_15360 [Pseudooceanicola nanhaiensis]|uniref:hypothetical protein n=1 Tax=Rhodobacterales TaxID=204455 RepID=UPI004059F86D
MNALELHILTTIADAPGAYPEDFKHCRTTLCILQANGLLKPDSPEKAEGFAITDRGLEELRRELQEHGRFPDTEGQTLRPRHDAFGVAEMPRSATASLASSRSDSMMVKATTWLRP